MLRNLRRNFPIRADFPALENSSFLEMFPFLCYFPAQETVEKLENVDRNEIDCD